MTTHTDNSAVELLAGDTIRVPIIEETLEVGTRSVETGRVRLTKTVSEDVETVDVPLLHTGVQVERVAVNRIVDGPQPVRTEGDTTVYPILEEVLVVEKRLMLREEVRVTRQVAERHDPQQVTLRREELLIESLEPHETL